MSHQLIKSLKRSSIYLLPEKVAEENWENLFHMMLSFAKTYNCSFHAIDLNQIIEHYVNWIKLLPRVKPYFVHTLQRDPKITYILGCLGCGFSCASYREVSDCVTSVPKLRNDERIAKDIIVSNPFKLGSDMKHCFKLGVKMTTFMNKTELDRLKIYWPDAELLIAVITNPEIANHEFTQSKMAANLDDVDELLDYAKQLDLNVVGLVCFHGTHYKTCTNWTDLPRIAADITKKIEDHDFKMKILSLGDGFDFVDAENEEQDWLKFQEDMSNLSNGLNDYFPLIGDGFRKDLEIIAQPSRYFVQKAELFAFKVMGKRLRSFNEHSTEPTHNVQENGSEDVIGYISEKRTIEIKDEIKRAPEIIIEESETITEEVNETIEEEKQILTEIIPTTKEEIKSTILEEIEEEKNDEMKDGENKRTEDNTKLEKDEDKKEDVDKESKEEGEVKIEETKEESKTEEEKKEDENKDEAKTEEDKKEENKDEVKTEEDKKEEENKDEVKTEEDKKEEENKDETKIEEEENKAEVKTEEDKKEEENKDETKIEEEENKEEVKTEEDKKEEKNKDETKTEEEENKEEVKTEEDKKENENIKDEDKIEKKEKEKADDEEEIKSETKDKLESEVETKIEEEKKPETNENEEVKEEQNDEVDSIEKTIEPVIDTSKTFAEPKRDENEDEDSKNPESKSTKDETENKRSKKRKSKSTEEKQELNQNSVLIVENSQYMSFNFHRGRGHNRPNYWLPKDGDLKNLKFVDAALQVPSVLYGNTCDSLDVISNDLTMPRDVDIGDHLVWVNRGTYGSCLTSQFNGIRPPKHFHFINNEKLTEFMAHSNIKSVSDIEYRFIEL